MHLIASEPEYRPCAFLSLLFEYLFLYISPIENDPLRMEISWDIDVQCMFSVSLCSLLP